MKMRKLAYAVHAQNVNGHTTPPIYVNAETYTEAKAIARQRMTLVKRYPDQWHIF